MNYTYIIIYTIRNYICIKFYLYIKRHTGILTDIELRYTYILYTDRISYFCKKISYRKGKKGHEDIRGSFARYGEEGRDVGHVPHCSRRALVFPRDGVACSFAATINVNEHYRDLAALTGKSLRLSFVLDALKNSRFRLFGEIGL